MQEHSNQPECRPVCLLSRPAQPLLSSGTENNKRNVSEVEQVEDEIVSKRQRNETDIELDPKAILKQEIEDFKKMLERKKQNERIPKEQRRLEYETNKEEIDAMLNQANTFTRWVAKYACYITQMEKRAKAKENNFLVCISTHTAGDAKAAIALARKIKSVYGNKSQDEMAMQKANMIRQANDQRAMNKEKFDNTLKLERDIINSHIELAKRIFGDKVHIVALRDQRAGDAAIRFEGIGMPEGFYLILQYKTTETAKGSQRSQFQFSGVSHDYYQGMVIVCVYKRSSKSPHTKKDWDNLIWCLEPNQINNQGSKDLTISYDLKKQCFMGGNVSNQVPVESVEDAIGRLKQVCEHAVANPHSTTVKLQTLEEANAHITSDNVKVEQDGIDLFTAKIKEGLEQLQLPPNTITLSYDENQQGKTDFKLTVKSYHNGSANQVVLTSQSKTVGPLLKNGKRMGSNMKANIETNAGRINGKTMHANTYKKGDNDIYVMVYCSKDNIPTFDGKGIEPDGVWIFDEHTMIEHGRVLNSDAPEGALANSSLYVHSSLRANARSDGWTAKHYCHDPVRVVEELIRLANLKMERMECE